MHSIHQLSLRKSASIVKAMIPLQNPTRCIVRQVPAFAGIIYLSTCPPASVHQLLVRAAMLSGFTPVPITIRSHGVCSFEAFFLAGSIDLRGGLSDLQSYFRPLFLKIGFNLIPILRVIGDFSGQIEEQRQFCLAPQLSKLIILKAATAHRTSSAYGSQGILLVQRLCALIRLRISRA